jgi:TolB-like protein
MKGLYLFYILFQLVSSVYAVSTIAILDFDAGDFCTQQQALVMSDAFRNEMVRSGRVDVVTRNHLDALKSEIIFQMSDWADLAKIRQVGHILGVDYFIFGRFGIMGKKGYLQIELTEVKTGRIIHSSRIDLLTWNEFDRKVVVLAEEFINKLGNSISYENTFIGTWVANVLFNDIDDTYSITFIDNSRCLIKVTSYTSSGEIKQETQGNYSFDGNILKINAIFRNSQITHISTLQWASVISMNVSNTSFNILIKAISNKNDQTKVTFFRN